MIEPVIECPHCHKEIKLTESLAAPLVEATRQEFELKLAEKDSEVARRETELRAGEQSLATARQQIDAQIEEGIRRERQTIAAEEAQKARRLVSDELEGKARELADLQQSSRPRMANWPKPRRRRPSLFASSGSSTTKSANSNLLSKLVFRSRSAPFV